MALRPESVETEELSEVFHALAHPERRRLLDLVKADPGCILKDLVPHFAMSRIGVMKHLKVLEGAGLILAQPEGRQRHLYFNLTPIQRIYDRWTDEHSALWAGRLLRLKETIESRRDGEEDEL